MKNCITYFFTAFFILAFLVTGCNKKDGFTSDAAGEYTDMAVGKYIIYRYDSTLFINFGQQDTVITYLAKDLVEESTTDALGRPSWRVVRYLRDTGSTSESDWVAKLTYLVTPSAQSVEVNENNLRFVKLKQPLKDGYDWLGNSYLPSDPFMSLFLFSNDEDIQQWDYTYESTGITENINNTSYDNTLTVLQVADSVNVPITFFDGIAYRNYWVEKYAKNIGLIYKEVVMWEYQPPIGGNPGYRHGFGLKMTIVDHN